MKHRYIAIRTMTKISVRAGPGRGCDDRLIWYRTSAAIVPVWTLIFVLSTTHPAACCGKVAHSVFAIGPARLRPPFDPLVKVSNLQHPWQLRNLQVPSSGTIVIALSSRPPSSDNRAPATATLPTQHRANGHNRKITVH
jgi:hypothetical protein